MIAAVEGMGGVGKTELAIQYSLLHLQLNTYPGGICWLRAREQNIGLQIVNFARTDLGLQPPEDLELPDRVRWCWKRWQKGNTLIVLDDVTNYSDIKPYLPPQPSQFKVLITTRLKLDLSSSLYLEVLPELDALELLKQLIGSEKVNQELETAKELCQRLGYLPLALQLVGQYVKKRGISLTKELGRLEGKGLAHPSLRVPENKRTWTLDIQRGVKAAFELSWQELTDEAQTVALYLSLFAVAPIPYDFIQRVCPIENEDELEEILEDSLVSLSLVKNLGKQRYEIHTLIQQYLRDKLEESELATTAKETYCQLMTEIAQEIPDSPVQSDIQNFTPFIPHLVVAARELNKSIADDDLGWVYVGLERFYQEQGLYQEAEPWCEQCLSIVGERLGEDHPHVALSLNNLAALYYLQGRYEEAKPLYLQALELYQRLLGEDHSDVALSLNNLAELYRSQGRYEEAEPLSLQALKLRKRLLGEDHPHVATSLNNLAALYDSQGRYDEAEPLFLQALELSKRLLGEDHPSVATSLNNLAALYYDQGRYDEAEPLYLQALKLSKRLLGEDHPSVAKSLNNLAVLYDSQGRYEEAKPLYLQALELSKRLLGEDHPHVATSLNNLAALYDSQGRYDEAEPLFLQALELSKRLLGEDHPSVATSLNNLAALYYDQGRYDEAEPLYLQALKLSKRLLGEDHPSVAQSLNNLAVLYRSQGRYDEAEPLYFQALELSKRLLGEDHPHVAKSLNNLAELYYLQGRYDEAEPLSLQALTIAEKALGKNHPNTNTFRENYKQLKKTIKKRLFRIPNWLKIS